MKLREKKLFFYASKIIVAIIFLLIYFFGLRPLRRTITQQLALPVITSHLPNSNLAYQFKNKGTAVAFTFQRGDATRTLRYQPQLGLFFLLACIALLFITARLKWYLYLIACHVFLLFVVFGILYASCFGWYPGLVIIDFL